MPDYEVTSSRVTHEGSQSRIRVDRVRLPDGDEVDREVVEHPDAVAVVALDEADRVVLVRQYRHALRRHVRELPAGKLDVDGEPAADAMRRELREEVGLDADGMTVIARFANSGGWTEEHTTLFLATGLHDAGPPDGFEAHGEEAHMEVERVPLDVLARDAVRGEIDDAKTLIGVLLVWARRHGADPEGPPPS